jgi:hypothetical protein
MIVSAVFRSIICQGPIMHVLFPPLPLPPPPTQYSVCYIAPWLPSQQNVHCAVLTVFVYYTGNSKDGEHSLHTYDEDYLLLWYNKVEERQYFWLSVLGNTFTGGGWAGRHRVLLITYSIDWLPGFVEREGCCLKKMFSLYYLLLTKVYNFIIKILKA